MPSYAQQVVRKEVGPCNLVALETGVRDVVSVRLSFDTHPDFKSGDDLLQDVTAAMLDKGTGRRDRFELASMLEVRGAHLSFSGSGVRVRASARFLRGDADVVIPLIGEILTDPAFDEGELEKTKQRLTGAIQRSMTDARHRAAVALARHSFDVGHPGYMSTPEEDLAALEAVNAEALRSYHASRFRGPVRIVATGDVDTDAVARAFEQAFSDWPEGERPMVSYADPGPTDSGTARAPIPDRPNLDVLLGHPVPVRRDDPDYDALRLGVFALGGNFSARLMASIRDELGLTYGIGSSLTGIGIHYGGLWQTALTLSVDRLQEGIEATRRELERFVSGGITANELDEKKETLSGRFVVGLATSGGLAGALLSAEEYGFGERYLDEYPGRIAAVTLDEVNRAIRAHLDPQRLFVSIAGSVAV